MTNRRGVEPRDLWNREKPGKPYLRLSPFVTLSWPIRDDGALLRPPPALRPCVVGARTLRLFRPTTATIVPLPMHESSYTLKPHAPALQLSLCARAIAVRPRVPPWVLDLPRRPLIAPPPAAVLAHAHAEAISGVRKQQRRRRGGDAVLIQIYGTDLGASRHRAGMMARATRRRWQARRR